MMSSTLNDHTHNLMIYKNTGVNTRSTYDKMKQLYRSDDPNKRIKNYLRGIEAEPRQED